MQPQQQNQGQQVPQQQYVVNAPPPGYAVPGGGSPLIPGIPTQLPPEKPSKGPIIGLVIAIFLLVVAVICIGYFYAKMQDYKNNSDGISAKAVTKAKEEQKKELEAQFAEQEKSPLKSYTTPEAYGSVKIVYPKTLARYDAEGASNPVDVYFYPEYIPGLSDSKVFSLRVQVLNSSYKSVLSSNESAIKNGQVTATAYQPEQMKNATPGVRINGKISGNKVGSKVILPLRDKTIVIWAESEEAVKDLDQYVLKNLTYVP